MIWLVLPSGQTVNRTAAMPEAHVVVSVERFSGLNSDAAVVTYTPLSDQVRELSDRC